VIVTRSSILPDRLNPIGDDIAQKDGILSDYTGFIACAASVVASETVKHICRQSDPHRHWLCW
jgi:hypothetical protein